MRLKELHIRNYRTFEDIRIRFESYYTAVSGKNDSGKTNLLRIIRTLMREDDPYGYTTHETISVKSDYPKWKDAAEADARIQLHFEFAVDPNSDAGMHRFLTQHLALGEDDRSLDLVIEADYTAAKTGASVTVHVGDKTAEDTVAEDVLKKIQSSRCFLFHDSTDPSPPFPFARGFAGIAGALAPDHEGTRDTIKNVVTKGLRKIARAQQTEIADLLGHFESKYTVGLTFPTIDVNFLPFSIALSRGQVEVPLKDWGSGTQNRTIILMTVLRARQIAESETSASKITPIILIEEPECFLHPSARGEFGKILQQLAEDFKVQVIVTTHSPYMLSQGKPNSNILFERRRRYSKDLQTDVVDTSGENWMEPFALALGVDNSEFTPWRELFLTHSQSLLLVEGDIDKKYFELLQDTSHGDKRLKYDGQIFAYSGASTLGSHIMMLSCFKSAFQKLFVTFDLDAQKELEPKLKKLGMQRRKDYLAVGVDEDGKKFIEGLVPEFVKQAVQSRNTSLVDAAMSGGKQARDARLKLKHLYFTEFKANATPGEEYYGAFYPLVKVINKALC